MYDIGMIAIWTGSGNRGVMTAGVANELEIVVMQSEGKKTMRASGLPATMVTDGERGGATAVVKDEDLVMVFEVVLDVFEELIGKIAIFGEICAIFEVDEVNFWRGGSSFGFFV